ncbi:hypothetical protein MKW98_028950, partial [Papaver atlanticum]
YYGTISKTKIISLNLSKLPERPTKKSSASIRRGDRRRNEDIVEEVDKDNASEESSEDSRNDASDKDTVEEVEKDTVEEVDKDTVEDDNNEEEFDEESSDEDDEDNLGEADVGRASSSEKGKKAVEAMWENENPRENPIPLLKLHQHQDMVKTKWPLDKECVEVQEYVKKSGLYSLIKYGHDFINAFRERWYPETNTYHLPFGEMTITIEDLNECLGRRLTWDYTYDLIKRTLGKTKKELEIEKAFGGTAKKLERKLKLNWLRKKFTSKKNDSKKGKSNVLEHTYFMFKWATTCLAWTYHHLGQGSRTEVYSMSGCMTILQVWIYDHFPVLERHNLVGGYEECNPRASLYIPIQPERTLELDLVDLHEKLDDLTEEKVTWDPYKSIRDGSIHQVGHYTGPLKCFDVVEWHNTNRVLRQFGVIQDKPNGVFLDKEKTVSKPSSFNWSAWDTCLIPKGSLQCKVLNPWDCEDGYKKWFSEVSHTRVANLNTRILAKPFIDEQESKVANIKRNVGIIRKFVFNSGAEDEPISHSGKAHLLEMLENYDNPERSDLFPDSCWKFTATPTEEEEAQELTLCNGYLVVNLLYFKTSLS